MINAIINGIWTVVQTLIAVILAPIDLILRDVPFLDQGANQVLNFRNTLSQIIAWPFDFLNPALESAIFGFILAWLFFANASRAVSLIKLAYNWLQKLKFW